MCVHSWIGRLALLGIVVLPTAACYRSTAPERWLTAAAVAQREPYGGWIHVQYDGGPSGGLSALDGELIAAESDSLFILTTNGLQSVPNESLRSGEIVSYVVPRGDLGRWTGVLVATTLTHGYVLLLTAPVWTAVGIGSTAAATHAPRVQSVTPAVLRTYARFPQGLPPHLDRGALRPKPLSRE